MSTPAGCRAGTPRRSSPLSSISGWVHGALFARRILSWATAQSAWWLAFWASIAAGVSLIETAILKAQNSPDTLNSLRFANQIYSVLIVILLLRIRRRSWPSFVNVADTTYGVYLTHGAAITVALRRRHEDRDGPRPCAGACRRPADVGCPGTDRILPGAATHASLCIHPTLGMGRRRRWFL